MKKEKLLVESKANERRFRELTRSRGLFWETDAEHRMSGFGGARWRRFRQISTTAGISGRSADEVEPLARGAPRGCRTAAFFDLEIGAPDERGARQIHIISAVALRRAGRFAGYRGVAATSPSSAAQSTSCSGERGSSSRSTAQPCRVHIDLHGNAIFAGDGWVRFLGYEQSPESPA